MNAREWLKHEMDGLRALETEALRVCDGPKSVAQATSDLEAKLHPLAASRLHSFDSLAFELGVGGPVLATRADLDAKVALAKGSHLEAIAALRVVAAVYTLLLEIAEARGLKVELPE